MMTRPTSLRSFVSFAAPAAVVLGACGRAPSASEVAEATGTQVSELVRGANDSAQVINSLSSLGSLTSGLNALRTGFAPVPVDGRATCDPATPGCTTFSPTPYARPTAPEQPSVNEQTEKMVKFLKERVFTEENIESRNASSTTFLLTGEDVCTDGTTTPSQGCVDQVNKLELRVRATPQSDNGMDLTLVIGPDRNEPVTFQVRRNSLALVIDLAQAKATAEFVASQGGTSSGLPRVMEGVIEFRLVKNADKDFTFSGSVLRDVRVEWDDSNGATRKFSTATASPLAALRIEAIPRRVSFDLDLRSTVLDLPYKPDLSRTGYAGTRLVSRLSGLSYSFTAQEGQTGFAVAHIGIGDAQSTVMLDNLVIVAADLNTVSGRHFDLKLASAADGLPVATVAPEFDLATKFFLKPLKVDTDVSVPSFYEDETYRVLLTGGSAPAVKPVAADAVTGFPGGLKVIAGALTLSTTAAGVAPVVVSQGQCLVGRRTAPTGSHPLLGHFGVQACP